MLEQLERGIVMMYLNASALSTNMQSENIGTGFLFFGVFLDIRSQRIVSLNSSSWIDSCFFPIHSE